MLQKNGTFVRRNGSPVNKSVRKWAKEETSCVSAQGLANERIGCVVWRLGTDQMLLWADQRMVAAVVWLTESELNFVVNRLYSCSRSNQLVNDSCARSHYTGVGNSQNRHEWMGVHHFGTSKTQKWVWGAFPVVFVLVATWHFLKTLFCCVALWCSVKLPNKACSWRCIDDNYDKKNNSKYRETPRGILYLATS